MKIIPDISQQWRSLVTAAGMVSRVGVVVFVVIVSNICCRGCCCMHALKGKPECALLVVVVCLCRYDIIYYDSEFMYVLFIGSLFGGR